MKFEIYSDEFTIQRNLRKQQQERHMSNEGGITITTVIVIIKNKSRIEVAKSVD